jgi:uncharacterized protein (TIGR04255 family)
LSWTPLHAAHAIERTRVGLQFAEQAPSKLISRIGQGFESKRSEFGFGPRIERQVSTLMVTEGSGAPSVVESKANGWQFARSIDSVPVFETLIFEPQAMIYETLEYSRWNTFLSRFNVITEEIINSLQQTMSFASVTLEYVDRFMFSDANSLPSPAGLIAGNLSSVLPVPAQEGRTPWHIHRGWFEEVKGIRLLVNQNIDALPVKGRDGATVQNVQIYTKIERRGEVMDLDRTSLNHNLNAMHDLSKIVVISALSGEIRKKVGLDQ